MLQFILSTDVAYAKPWQTYYAESGIYLILMTLMIYLTVIERDFALITHLFNVCLYGTVCLLETLLGNALIESTKSCKTRNWRFNKTLHAPIEWFRCISFELLPFIVRQSVSILVHITVL